MARRVVALVALVLCAATATARAEGDDPTTDERRYGWQTGLADLAAVGAAAATAIPWVGAGLFACGDPAIHMANGSPGRALASLVVRVSMPAAGDRLGARQVAR